MQPRPGERSAPRSSVLTVRTSHDKSLCFEGPQHAAEITGVNSQAATKLANFGSVVSNFPKQSSLVHWATSLEKLVVEGTDALRNCSVETADLLNRGFLYFSDHSQRLCPKLQMHMNCTALFRIAASRVVSSCIAVSDMALITRRKCALRPNPPRLAQSLSVGQGDPEGFSHSRIQ